MKEYLKFFRWVLLIIGILVVLLAAVEGFHKIKASAGYYERTNTECTQTQRVFDYADVLSEKEEQKLEKLIVKRQKQTCCDIVLVTLQESLEEYAREIDPDVPNHQFVKIYAEQFYEENHFGYNKSNGDGVLLVDNWYRESDGKIYTWFCTTGIVKDTYSSADIDHILDRVYRKVEKNPYQAYKTYVNDFYDDMMGNRVFHEDVPASVSLLAGVIAAVGFILFNWKSKSGKNTTTAVTYVEGKRADFTGNRDTFIRKSVTKRHIETSSSGGSHSSGGGGGHSSGGSHGGGGHSR